MEGNCEITLIKYLIYFTLEVHRKFKRVSYYIYFNIIYGRMVTM